MARWGKCDFKGFERFEKRLEQLGEERLEEFYTAMVKEIAARVLALAIKRPKPVTGTLKRGWTVTQVDKQGGTYRIDVLNPVKYASYVEFGHRAGKKSKRWVQGQFMLTIAENELNEKGPGLIEKRLDKLLREAMKAD